MLFLAYNLFVGYLGVSCKSKPLDGLHLLKEDLRDLPEDVQSEVGYSLYQAQQGLFPDTAKPLKGIRGVFEIVCDFNRGSYRAVYATQVGEHLYVLHVFQKKSTQGTKTPKHEIDLIKQRLQWAQKIAKGG